MIAGKHDDILCRGKVVHGKGCLPGADAFSQFADRGANLNVEIAARDPNAGNAAPNLKLHRLVSPQYLTSERTIWHLHTLPTGENAPNRCSVKPLTSIVSAAS